MGICYKLLMCDEFDWGYLDSSKEETLKKFEDEYPGYCDKIAEWYGCVVFDVDKSTPYLDERKKVIAKYCDAAYYIDDLDHTDIVEIELPRKVSPEQKLLNTHGNWTKEQLEFMEKRAEELTNEKKCSTIEDT